MTEREPPSALLERAAARLSELAEKASEGSWWVEWTSSDWRDTTPSKVFGRGKPLLEDTGDAYVGDLEWIATLSPAVAPPLVEWLRHSATSVREHDEDLVVNGEPSRYCPNEEQALTFARLVLGEPKNTP